MGFDMELVLTAIPEYLICPLCDLVLKDPRRVCLSEHFACGECLAAYLAREDEPQITCLVSNCNELFSRYNLLSSDFVDRALATLEVQCNMSECDWRGSYDKFENHVLKSCEVQRRDCELCGDKIFTKEQEIHIADVCLEKKLVCPRGGKKCGKYLRKDEEKHAASCCSYECREDATCPTRTSLRYLAAHEQECKRLRDELFDAQQELSELDSITEDDAEEEVEKRFEEEVTKRVEEEIKKRSSNGKENQNKKRKKTKEAKLQAEIDRLQREVAELAAENNQFKRK